MEDIEKIEKISSSEGTRVKLRGRGSEDKESRQSFEELFCKGFEELFCKAEK